MAKKRETNLNSFIKNECSNFKVCEYSCLVLDGKRCGYFEQNVLITNPDYKYRLPGYDYSKLFAQYAEQTHTKPGKVRTRRCSCGEPIGYRQRMCKKCRESKRRESYRNSKRSKRFSVHT